MVKHRNGGKLGRGVGGGGGGLTHGLYNLEGVLFIQLQPVACPLARPCCAWKTRSE